MSSTADASLQPASIDAGAAQLVSFVHIEAFDLRRRYEAAKDHAHVIGPVNHEVYNRAKEAVIQEIQCQVE